MSARGSAAGGSTATPLVHRELRGDFVGQRAIDRLASLLDAEGPQLELIASRLGRIDAIGGAIVLSAGLQHLDEHPGGRIQVWEPREEDSHARLRSLLAPEGDGWSWCGDHARPRLDRRVVLPATALRDLEDDALIVETLPTLLRARAGIAMTDEIALAAATLIDNARRHAAAPKIDTVVACVMTARRSVQLVVADRGAHPPTGDAPALLAAVEPAGDLGFLLARRAGRQGRLRMAAGARRLDFGERGVPAPLTVGAFVPGLVAVYDVQF